MHIESTKIDSLYAFKMWTRQSLRVVLPHEVLCCGFGRLNSGSPSVDGVVSIDYPTEILQSIQNNAGGIDSPLLKRWLIRRTPITFSGENPWPDMPANWLEQFRRFDLRNAAVHAVSDDRISIGTYYSFHRIPEHALPLYEALLEKIAPIMHLALSPLIFAAAEADPVSKALKTLSKRELEIVRWVKVGKTNKEIADILNVAEMTVKHHMFNIFEKFGDIGSRVQLATRLTIHESEKSMSSARLKII
jgi:transcriptional regulator EpsA